MTFKRVISQIKEKQEEKKILDGTAPGRVKFGRKNSHKFEILYNIELFLYTQIWH